MTAEVNPEPREKNDEQLARCAQGLIGITDCGTFEQSSVGERHDEPIYLGGLRAQFEEDMTTISHDSWPTNFSAFLSRIGDEDYSRGERRLVRGWAARLLEKAYTLSLAEGKGAALFGQELEGVLTETGMPPALAQEDDEVVAGKRQPALPESIEATLERYTVVEGLSQAFGHNAEGIILSGSMAYGPFFNVRKQAGRHSGETWNSDIDVLLVLGEVFAEHDGWDELAQSNLLVADDVISFLERKAVFAEMLNNGEADVFTHRFDINGYDFNLGIHCLPIDKFIELFDTRLAIDLDRNEDMMRVLRDYKPTVFRRPVCFERGFDGSTYEYVVPKQQPVDGGVVASLSGYIISGGKFYPGLWQSMALPEFLVSHDASGRTGRVVNDFRSHMMTRVAQEKTLSPKASLARAHIRHEGFAPERYDEYGIRR